MLLKKFQSFLTITIKLIRKEFIQNPCNPKQLRVEEKKDINTGYMAIAFKAPKFKEDKDGIRKFHPKDFLVHADDMVEMLVLLKIPFAKQLHIDKLLALIYAKCGYETGIKDTDNKGHGHHH